MPKKTSRIYPQEYRHRLVEMARAGRSPESLAKDFEPTAQCIRNWVFSGGQLVIHPAAA